MELTSLLNAAEDDTGDWELDGDNLSEQDTPWTTPSNWSEDEETKSTEEACRHSSSHGRTGNCYVASIEASSGLHIKHEANVRRAYSERQEVGLFSLFLSATYRETLRAWMNHSMLQEGKPEVTSVEFDAYIGMEIAMSILPITAMKDFWSEKRFLGQRDVAETMARNRFETIRASVRLHAPHHYTEAYKLRDPLWHSRGLLRHIQTKFAEIAVPLGAASLDENTVRTKARSSARTYLPFKPDKYGIRFYAVVGWQSLYVHSVYDNGSGNTESSPPAERYCKLFPELRRPLARIFDASNVSVKKDSASALWVAMIGHMTRPFEAPSRRRILVCDNYYTRHELAKAISTFTDDEVRIIGTCKIKQMGKWNEIEIAKSVARVKEMDRGCWELVAAVDVPSDWSNMQVAQAISIKAATGTPSQRILSGASQEAIDLCHGLAPIRRWTGEQSLHRKTLYVPATIAAYNIFMNAVDRVDQLRSTNPIRRKEPRLEMSLFTWALDMSLINSIALLRKIEPTKWKQLTLREFKRRVAESLTEPQLRRMRLKHRNSRVRERVQDIVGSDCSPHMLTKNSTKHSNGKLSCYLCSLRGLSKKARYGCTKCMRGYHPECFTAFHYRDAFTSQSQTVRSALQEVIAASEGATTGRARLKQNKTIATLDELTLPEG